jgi:hypothetical protein
MHASSASNYAESAMVSQAQLAKSEQCFSQTQNALATRPFCGLTAPLRMVGCARLDFRKVTGAYDPTDCFSTGTA